MFHLSKRGNVAPFYAMDVLAKANQYKADGKDIISMAIGQPAAPAPRKVIEAAEKALKGGKIGYTDANGLRSLRERISQYYEQHHNIFVDPLRIVVTTGSSAAFNLAFLSYFDEGDSVAIARPGYPAYRNILSALGINIVEIDTPDGRSGIITAQDVIEAFNITPFKALLFASPANPTGGSISASEMQELLKATQERDIHIISDEIYHRLNYTGTDITALSYSQDVTVINSFSKYYCMTGWRIGWMVVPQAALKNIERVMQSLYICAPELSQIAACAAFDATDELEKVKQSYVINRDILKKALPQLGFKLLAPLDGAFYAYCDATHFTNDSLSFVNTMLDETGVAVTPGCDFDPQNGNKTIRFSYAGSESEILEAMDRLQKWLKA